MSAISARKLAANRANAAASTGPRTAAGKARSALNAVRHGLCSESGADPAIIRAIERLGRELAGSAVGEERTLAYRAAAAQVDLERAQQAQHRFLSDPRVAALVASGASRGAAAPDALDRDGDLDAMVALLCDTVRELETIKRYEERAFGRRRRAIRALDGARAGERPRQRRAWGLRLTGWRLRPPSFTIIRFEGLPRWAWWRPDPLATEPRSPSHRKAGARVRLRPGRVSDYVATGERAAQVRKTNPPAADEPAPDARLPAAAPTAPGPTIPTDPTGEHCGTKPPPAPTQSVPANEAATPAPPASAEAAQSGETKPPRWGATAVPIPTCRVGPCRWVGEPPAEHWTIRRRYLRPPMDIRLARLGVPRWRRSTAAARAPP